MTTTYKAMVNDLCEFAMLHTDDMGDAIIRIRDMVQRENMPPEKIREVYEESLYPALILDDMPEQQIEGIAAERGEEGLARMVAEMSIVFDFTQRWQELNPVY